MYTPRFDASVYTELPIKQLCDIITLEPLGDYSLHLAFVQMNLDNLTQQIQLSLSLFVTYCSDKDNRDGDTPLPPSPPFLYGKKVLFVHHIG